MPDPVSVVRAGLLPLANAERAVAMAAYMKTEQAFFGVSEPDRRPTYRELVGLCAPRDAKEYRATVLSLWTAGKWPHPAGKSSSAGWGQREFRYAACFFAQHFDEHHVAAHLPLWKRLIEEAAWWDLVDWISNRIVSPTALEQRAKTMPVMERWIDDPSLWVRRAAILCQIRHKEATDERVLYDFCLRRADEPEFFIRKAIGWSLRTYAATNPKSVKAFLAKHKKQLSPLSLREAAKHL